MCVGEGVRAPDLIDSLTAVSTQLPAHFAAVRFLRGKKKNLQLKFSSSISLVPHPLSSSLKKICCQCFRYDPLSWGLSLWNSSEIRKMPCPQLTAPVTTLRPARGPQRPSLWKAASHVTINLMQKNENGKRSDILFRFLLLVLENRTKATYDWNKTRLFLANKQSPGRISTQFGLESILKRHSVTILHLAISEARDGVSREEGHKWLTFREYFRFENSLGMNISFTNKFVIAERSIL